MCIPRMSHASVMLVSRPYRSSKSMANQPSLGSSQTVSLHSSKGSYNAHFQADLLATDHCLPTNFPRRACISDKITTRAKRPVPQPLKALLTLVCVSAVLAATYFGSTTIFQIIIYTIYYTQVGHPAPAPE